jgi:hypothetical protein
MYGAASVQLECFGTLASVRVRCVQLCTGAAPVQCRDGCVMLLMHQAQQAAGIWLQGTAMCMQALSRAAVGVVSSGVTGWHAA